MASIALQQGTNQGLGNATITTRPTYANANIHDVESNTPSANQKQISSETRYYACFVLFVFSISSLWDTIILARAHYWTLKHLFPISAMGASFAMEQLLFISKHNTPNPVKYWFTLAIGGCTVITSLVYAVLARGRLLPNPKR